MRLHKKRHAAVLAAACLSSTIAFGAGAVGGDGADIVFSAGRVGGGYWGVGERLREVAAEDGLKVEVRESVGSIQNLQRLNDPADPVNLTLTQADALKRYLGDEPSFGEKFEILEYIGLECVFVIASAEGGIENDQDLQDPDGHRIAIPGADSGVAVTFDYMSELVPGLSNTEPVYTNTLEAMQGFTSAEGVDAVMLVHRPKLRSPELELAVNEPDKYRLIPVEDRHLADKLPNGEAVYEFLDLPLKRAGFSTDKSVPTICTKGLLIASGSKLGPKAKAGLKRIIDFQWMRIYPTEL